ncbi:MAG: ribonuclease H-like domain-containing protein [Bacteroidales bacterium]
MLNRINLNDVLFLDIETAPVAPDYARLPENLVKHWDKKARHLRGNEEEDPEVTFRRAGVFAEFAKIICISTGFIKQGELRIKSFFGHEEKEILAEFAGMLVKHFNSDKSLLCAHNGKEFDFPFLARRMLVNRIEIPDILDNAGKKPWEIRHLDTMELWKFGDYKSFTSLELLTTLLDIPNPKNDIDGSEVGRVYWVDNDLPRIVEYCQRDVIALARLLLRYKNKPLISDDSVIIV